jgi:hypothetical protein
MAMPASISAGDLLLAIFEHDGSAATTGGWPAGWTVFPELPQSNGTLASQIAYKYAAGGESNFTLTTSGAEASNSRCYRITGHAGTTRPPLCSAWLGAGAAGTNAAPVSPYEWKQPQDILAIIALGWENTTPTPTPSGYTNEVNASGGGAGIRCETRAISGFSGTEDPAAYTTGSGGRAGWTILIPSDADDPDFSFPIVRTWIDGKGVAGTSTVNVILPLQREVGDILVVAIGLITNVTISSGLPSGWTTEVSVAGGGAGGERLYVLWKRCEASDVDFDLTLSAASSWDLVSCAILNMADDTDVISGTATGGSNANPDPPDLSATADLWCAVEETEGRTVTAYPTNYTHRQATHTGGGGGIGIAFRQLAASSENPGTFTMSGNSFWAAATLAFGKAGPRYFQGQWVA